MILASKSLRKMVFKNARFQVLLHSSKIPISWGGVGWGTLGIRILASISPYCMLSFHHRLKTMVMSVGQAEPRDPHGESERTWFGICQLPQPHHSCRQQRHSTRDEARSGSPLTRLPLRLGTLGQNECVRPGPAKRASEARARFPPPLPSRDL